MLRIPHFLDIRLTDGDEVVSLNTQVTFYTLEMILVLISITG
jgi:hypothetical protein